MSATRTFTASTLKEMRREIAGDSILFKEQLLAESDLNDAAGFSDLFMAAGGDGASSPERFQLGLEYIFEGFLLHYGRNRLLKADENNFYLLAGDYMYARGLSAIAEQKDLACIRELAELIQLCSFIHGENRDPALALGAWAVTTLRLAAHLSGCGHDVTDSSSLGKIILGDVSDAVGLDDIYEKSLAAFPEEKRADLRQRCSDLNNNFLTEA